MPYRSRGLKGNEMRNSKPSWISTAALVICAFFVVLVLRVNNEAGKLQGAQAAYDNLSNVDKAVTKVLIDNISTAKPGDFIVFKDGHVARVFFAGKNGLGHLEMRIRQFNMDQRLVLSEWMVYRDIDRLVKQTDPDAGATALKFLSQ